MEQELVSPDEELAKKNLIAIREHMLVPPEEIIGISKLYVVNAPRHVLATLFGGQIITEESLQTDPELEADEMWEAKVQIFPGRKFTGTGYESKRLDDVLLSDYGDQTRWAKEIPGPHLPIEGDAKFLVRRTGISIKTLIAGIIVVPDMFGKVLSPESKTEQEMWECLFQIHPVRKFRGDKYLWFRLDQTLVDGFADKRNWDEQIFGPK
ncbi:hypothetical protein ACFL2U_00760 [Patescibacteria group bacterium]